MQCGDIVLSKLLDVACVLDAKRGGGEKPPLFFPFDVYHAG